MLTSFSGIKEGKRSGRAARGPGGGRERKEEGGLSIGK